MKKILIVIDVQKDFVNEKNEEVLKRISELVNSNKYDDVIFTKFINDKKSNWYKKLKYEGCLTEEGRKILIDLKIIKYLKKRYILQLVMN